MPDAILFDGEKEDKMFEGKSLNEQKRSENLNKDQVRYLTELFDEGLTGKKKARADVVEKEMRYVLKDDGTYRFPNEKWLTEARIKSFFSRLAAKRKAEKDQGIGTQSMVSEAISPRAGPSGVIRQISAGLSLVLCHEFLHCLNFFL